MHVHTQEEVVTTAAAFPSPVGSPCHSPSGMDTMVVASLPGL